jgi:hypothetical protein
MPQPLYTWGNFPQCQLDREDHRASQDVREKRRIQNLLSVYNMLQILESSNEDQL